MKECETIEFKQSLSELKEGLVSIVAIQMVEAWGRGMPLILKNEPNAKFKDVAGFFVASFGRPSFLANDAKETIDKTIDKPLSVTEKTIMELITANPSMTQKKDSLHS